MNPTQKHIINTLRVDVSTHQVSAAFHLKDHLDAFLKQEIFPYLEQYFSTVEEELQFQTLQIPYLHIDVNTSSALNFKELKEDLKRALVKSVERKVQQAHPNHEGAKLISTEVNTEKTFTHFLKTGTQPWWNSTESTFSFTEEQLEVLVASKNGQKEIRNLLVQTTARKRFIAQMSDAAIKSILEVVFPKHLPVLMTQEFLSHMAKVNHNDREWIWDALLDYGYQEDLQTLVSRFVFLLTKTFQNELSENKSTQELLQSEVQKNQLWFITAQVLSQKKSHTVVQQVLTLIERKMFSIQDNSIQKNQQTTITSSESTTLENESFKKHSEQLSAKKKTNKRQISEESTSIFEAVQKETEKTSEIFIEKDIKQDLKVQGESDGKNHPITEIEAREITERKENMSAKETSKQTEQTESLYNKETFQTTQSKVDLASRNPNESELQEKEAIISKELQSNKENTQFKKEFHESDATLKQLQAQLQACLEEQDQKLWKELYENQTKNPEPMEEKGELQVHNVGLIMLHPYLKDFFKNCGLLNDENHIINPSLAVHLLHYIATKQEQQYESSMVFEKIVCGLHSKDIIQRNVVLSDTLKSNAEELLEAVLQNWGVLKNASPDLLRSEFLQRYGKISFKETNPKITVEKKVHDILLDKLPWNIGLCRLPWLNYLLFTDW